MNKYLIPFWISFPKNDNFPIGFGVTAYSTEDAFNLLEEFNYNYHQDAAEVKVIENIKWDEIPWPNKTYPNMGPIVVRGIWFPHHNSR